MVATPVNALYIPSLTVTTQAVLSLRAGDSALQNSVPTATPARIRYQGHLMKQCNIEWAITLEMVINQPHPPQLYWSTRTAIILVILPTWIHEDVIGMIHRKSEVGVKL